MHRLLISMLILISSISLGMTLKDIESKIAHPVITADFTQKRILKEFNSTLESKGSVIVASKNGIFWKQHSPFNLSIILMKNKMIQILDNGDQEIINAKNNPQLFQFTSLLSSIFTMDEKELLKHFETSIKNSSTTEWSLNLIPRTSPLNKVFKTISINGNSLIKKIMLEDMSGDITIIDFYNQQAKQSLTPSEALYFE